MKYLTLALRDFIFPLALPNGIFTGSSYRESTLRKKLLIDSSYTPSCEKINNIKLSMLFPLNHFVKEPKCSKLIHIKSSPYKFTKIFLQIRAKLWNKLLNYVYSGCLYFTFKSYLKKRYEEIKYVQVETYIIQLHPSDHSNKKKFITLFFLLLVGSLCTIRKSYIMSNRTAHVCIYYVPDNNGDYEWNMGASWLVASLQGREVSGIQLQQGKFGKVVQC